MAWTSYTTRWTDVRVTSDVLYRERGKWISDRLTSLGWGKTADTGQIDWTTATRPGAPTANTKGGYEIRVSSGAGTDVYIKITYGLGYTSSILGLWLASGTGSDGAGTLTGSLTTERQMGTALGSGVPYESTWYLSGDADNFVFGFTNENNNANGGFFGLQRTCDASGVDTATGWFKYGMGYSGTATFSTCQMVNFSTGAKSADLSPGFGCTSVPRQMMTTAAPLIFSPLLAQDGSTYVALRDVMAQAGGSMFGINDLYHYGANLKFATVFAGTNAAFFGFTPAFNYYAGVRIA